MPSEGADPLIIQGIQVDPRLLEARPLRRCRPDECQSYCCGGGVSVSLAQVDDLLAHADLFRAYLAPDRQNPDEWFTRDETFEDTDHPAHGQYTYTAVFDDPLHPYTYACVFLRPDRKCALQLAGIEHGEHPWRYKPFYCALHPIEFNTLLVKLCEDNHIYQEGGSCSRPAAETPVPLYQLFADELKLALGEAGYAELQSVAAARLGASGPA
jgi:Protein of unknown function (DUF3109)